MEQAVGRSAQTIHRLLGYDGRRFEKGPGDSIDADILIIDELSMVDVRLAFHLFQSVDLSRTAVVLVGDHNQLPAVGPGNVLRDLVNSQIVPTTVLREVFRQAGPLKENSARILEGELRRTVDANTDGRCAWCVVDTLSEENDVRLRLEKLFAVDLSERLELDLLRDVQVLTPTHKGALGTVELNKLLQRVVQKKLSGIEVERVEDGHAANILVGDKVIQTVNNYDLDLMNGSVGVVLDIKPEGTMAVDFDGREVELEADEAMDLQLAYAATIHKMQGSEFPCAILIAHKSHARMHDRNLLYTAVTRAQKCAMILGDSWGVKNCAKAVQAGKRNTFLSVLLAPAAGDTRK